VDEEAAVHLALTLEWPAAQVLLDLPPVDQDSFEGLTAALKRQFGQRLPAKESRGQLANYRWEGERVAAHTTAQPTRRTLPCMPSCMRCHQNTCGST